MHSLRVAVAQLAKGRKQRGIRNAAVSDVLTVSCVRQETIFSAGARELFLSDHVEERLSLPAVLGGCEVKVAKPGAAAMLADASMYTCKFHYDHNAMCLRVLSAEECSAMEPSA